MATGRLSVRLAPRCLNSDSSLSREAAPPNLWGHLPTQGILTASIPQLPPCSPQGLSFEYSRGCFGKTPKGTQTASFCIPVLPILRLPEAGVVVVEGVLQRGTKWQKTRQVVGVGRVAVGRGAHNCG